MSLEPGPSRRPPRVAIVADYPEEGWTSMDLTAEMILRHLDQGHRDEVEAVLVRPGFRHRLGRVPIRRGIGRNVDRLCNRHLDYPRQLRRLLARERFDVVHIVDQSYAQLVLAAPPGRSVVTCHDLDTFRCLLRPEREPRPFWFRLMAGRVLRGFRRAAAVVCVSEATRDEVRAFGLVEERKLLVIPNGLHPEALEPPGEAARAEALRLVGPAEGPILLHVGSTIPRKRIDLLLEIVAAIRRAIPTARLVKVGGAFTPEQNAQVERLGLAGAVHHAGFVEGRPTLSALYETVDLVLQPSESEGFGLPLAEAMALGAPLLVSDLAVFREVAGEAALYRGVGDVEGWASAAVEVLSGRDPLGVSRRRALGQSLVGRYRWSDHVKRLVAVYHEVAGRAAPC